MIKSTEDDKLGECLVNAMKDMAIISYAILECSSDGQYIEVLILTQSSMVYLVKERFFVCQLNTMRIGPNAILMYYEGG